MAKRGAKDKYKTCVEPYLKDINKQIRNGITEETIAKSLNISVATLNNYKNKYPALKEALSKNKGADVLQDLINVGIEEAKGYYKENETTVIILDENGQPSKRQKTITKVWHRANPALNKFYVMNFGKEAGFTENPLDYELKKFKQDMEKIENENKNWFK